MVIALHVTNLTKELGSRIVLDKISFDVQKGEIFGIIGMSGCGKTTLLNHLIGFYEPDEGSVLYHTKDPRAANELQDLHRNPGEVKRLFGFAPQTPSFYPKLTVEENLFHFAALHQLERKKVQPHAQRLLELTKLEQHKDKLAEYLSGGMQRRLSIICGMIHNPEVLILDEPTADLDPLLRDETWALILSINKLGTTVVVASHFLQELEAVCDHVGIMDNGRLLKVGTLDALKEEFGQKAVEVQIETDPASFPVILAKLNRGNISRIRDRGRILTLHTQNAQATLFELAQLLRNGVITATALEVHRPTLKEVFEAIALGHT